MRVALVGPVYPYRGGIAHYTTMLCRALRERGHDVLMVSFKRQYPLWLYPGRSDKDPSEEPLVVEGTYYWIDSLNPITWLTTLGRIKCYQPDVLIIQWWSTFWAPFSLVFLGLYRSLLPLSPVVAFCHNVIPHESHWWGRFLAKMVLRLPTHYLVHSYQDKLHLVELIPAVRHSVIVVEFPPYEDVVSSRFTRSEARALLGLDPESRILLFFGLVRPYKGLMCLLQAVSQVRHHIPVHLLIVGEFWENKAKYLKEIDKMGLSPYVRIVDRYIPNEEIGLYFAAANVLVLPYLQTSHSAVLQIAFAMGLPVIASDVGGLHESVKEGVNGLLVKPGDSVSLAQVILKYFNGDLENYLRSRMSEVPKSDQWAYIASLIESLCPFSANSNKVCI